MKRNYPAYENLAAMLLFDGLKETDLTARGFAFKRDKTFKDLIRAVHRGIQMGMGSAEVELRMVATNLQRVLKVEGRV